MAGKRFTPGFLVSMGTLSFILLFSCSATGDNKNCNQVILVDKSTWIVSTAHHILPAEIGCPKERGGGDCEAIFRGKTEILRSSAKLCAVGNYLIFCKYKDSISIISSTENYTLPCDPLFYNGTHEINVCAPTGEDLRMTFQSEYLCGNFLGRENPIGKINVEQKQLYNNPMYLSRTKECYESSVVTDEAEGTILSGQATGDPDLYYCKADINMEKSGYNKVCLTFVEFTTPKGGPALKISGGKEDLVYNDANPIPATKNVCVSVKKGTVDVVLTLERGDPNKTLVHKFIIKYKAMKGDVDDDDDDDDDGDNKLLWLLVIPAIIVIVVVGCCIWRKRSKY